MNENVERARKHLEKAERVLEGISHVNIDVNMKIRYANAYLSLGAAWVAFDTMARAVEAMEKDAQEELEREMRWREPAARRATRLLDIEYPEGK